MPYDPERLPLLRAMPGARWNPADKTWRVSTAPGDRACVLELAGKLGLDVAPELAAPIVSEARDQALTRAADLYPFQRDGVGWLALRERALLADDMGLGKTVQALMALPAAARAIVVAPAAVKHNWGAETAKWRPDLRVRILDGRQTAVPAPAVGEIVIVNYDILPASLADKEGPTLDESTRSALRETTLIADEAHLVKNTKAARSKRFAALGQLCARTWLLTGTPLTNKPLDLWGVLRSGGMARGVFGGWEKFVTLFQGRKNRWNGWEFGDPAPEVPERLRRVMVRRTKAEVLPDLPPKRHQVLAVNGLSAGLRADLDAFEVEWAEAKDEGLPDFSQFSTLRQRLAEERIPALVETIEPYEDAAQPVVVFSAHRAPIDHLGTREGWATITGDTSSADRADIVRRFQAGELRGLACTIQAGGVGITLTRASAAIFVDLDWTPAWNLQAEDRICRIGQKADSLLIVRLVSTHPLERHVHDLLAKKIQLIQQAVESEIRIGPASGPSGLVDETDEELAARLAALEAAAKKIEREEERTWCGGRLEAAQENARRLGAPAEVEITAERKVELRRALSWMLPRCDGAVMDDGVGFSKSHAGAAHHIGRTGLADDDERTFRYLERTLVIYKAQLESGGFQLWPEDACRAASEGVR